MTESVKSNSTPPTVQVAAPSGFPEVTPGHDIGALIAEHCSTITWPDASRGLHDGDIVVVTSKIVSKSEGRIISISERESALAAQTSAVIATKTTPRGTTRIVRNQHGVVLAAAGIDASNAPEGHLLLLPEEPDESARHIRAALGSILGVRVGVVISDTLGRPWREGLTDAAIGVAGVAPLDDHRGRLDSQGVPLEVTVIAIADEIAAAADLVKGKATGNPVAVVRGLGHHVTAEDGPGSAPLIRNPAEDLFTLGTTEARNLGRCEAASVRRTVRTFTDEPVPVDAIKRAVAAAVTAPAPHHTAPWQFTHLSTSDTRTRVLSAMRSQWEEDLRHLDAMPDADIAKRITRGDILWRAPEVVFAWVDTSAAHPYPDERRQIAERDLFIAAGAAGVQNFLITLAAEGLGSAWVSSTMFCPESVRAELQINDTWLPLGAIAIGWPAHEPTPRSVREDLPLTQR